MADFEKIIRPFLLPDTAPSRPVPTSEQSSNDNATLAVSAKGQLKVYQINYSHSFTQYMTRQERETKTGDTSSTGASGVDVFNTVIGGGTPYSSDPFNTTGGDPFNTAGGGG